VFTNTATDRTKSIEQAVNIMLYGTTQEIKGLSRLREFHEDMDRQNAEFPLLDFQYNDRNLFYMFLNARILRKAPIDYLEVGVASGVSIKAWARLNKSPLSRFLGFDSFEGLPEDWKADAPKGSYSTGRRIPEIDDARVSFVKGLFQETVDAFSIGFRAQNRLVLHMDADLYSSTLYVLMHFERHMKPGTILIFDEFTARNCTDEYAALKDFCLACGRDYKIVAARRDMVKLAVELV